MAHLTEHRRALRAAVEPLLREGESCAVSVGPAESDKGLDTQNFLITVTVGPASDEATAERLDELLSGAVSEALKATELSPTVAKTSGYQNVPGAQLGATWTAQLIE